MLRLVNIDKTYKAASGDVNALKKVCLSFRKNEFVSVLGPSGSGKTTLLNIIGGLDKYTSGDLIIAGKSTKDFKDRDWDFYRNQRIGFIFQSYNLIPHQNVLSNVELALTISGISKTERVARAKEALDKVGLSDQYYKKPNQLSGGQCQRVAIARALVNNPEILLADEPTGALDTKTSEQIMKLIKEISQDRLVIMVTHNPDLADRYSTRIINLLDGEIVNDSNPYKEADEIKEVGALSLETVDKKSKAKMGLWTTNKLSFKNLLSKKGRTILVSIASSIGIIGVSTVLAVSFGVTNYVNDMQDDMLSSYPVEIAEKTVDMTSLLTGLTNSEKAELAKFDATTEVGMESMVNYLMDRYSDITNIKTNDINHNFLGWLDQLPSEAVAATQYNYAIDPTNNIFGKWNSSGIDEEVEQYVSSNGLTQRYIAELKTVNGFEEYASYVDLFTNFMKEMPGDEEYILNQCDLLDTPNAKFATEVNEMMLVVNKETTLTDLLLGQLGYYSHDDFIHIGQKAVKIYRRSDNPNEKGLKQKLEEGIITNAQYQEELDKLSEEFPYSTSFKYEDLVGKTFYYVPHETLWEYNESISTETKMQGTLLILGSPNMYYLNLDQDEEFDILSGARLNGSSIDGQVTYKRAKSSSKEGTTFLEGHWDQYDASGKIEGELNIAPGPGYNPAMKTVTGTDASKDPASPILGSGIGMAQESDIVKGYDYNIKMKNEWLTNQAENKVVEMKITGILRPKETTNFGSVTRGIYYTKAFSSKYIEDANKAESQIVNNETYGIKSYFKNIEDMQSFKAYCSFDFLNYKEDQEHPTLKTNGYAMALNGDLSNAISSLFSGALGTSGADATNKVYLRSLSGLKTIQDDETKEYSFDLLPQSVSIYPKDFEAKGKVTKHLDRWNSDETLTINGVEVKATDREQITYTDTVALIISVINTLITIVTAALVSFTSLSLVVSCFMIAVITYISVMERVKEIGVIRSLGGRKRDVNRLFTAENFMTGLASGVIGIAVTYLLSAVINIVVSFFGVPAIAALPWWMALIMIGLSIFLNVISGFLPSRKAAKQDPVVALRTE